MFMKFFRDYSLSIVLFVLFALSLIGQGYFQWEEFAINQQEHNQPIKLDEFTPEFLSRVFENWQSEFLQLLSFVILTSFLIHKGSAESKDSDEEIKNKLSNIEKMLKSKRS
jgi:hypothetical protein